ncbi:hypothetical protein ACFXTO_005839 [Malus domestica]
MLQHLGQATHLLVPTETLSKHDQVIKTNPDEATLDLHHGNSQPDDPRDNSFTQQAQPTEELEKVSISKDYPDRMVMISTTLSPLIRLALISFCKRTLRSSPGHTRTCQTSLPI